MANPLYGFSLYKSPANPVNEEYPVVGANSIAFTVGDPVLVSSTFANIPGSGNTTTSLIGIAAKTVTMSSTNQTVALVKVPIIPADQDYTFLAGANGELSLTTSAGAFFNLVVTGSITGQYLIDAATAGTNPNNALVVCVGVDPQNLGTTGVGGGSRMGLFKFIKNVGRNQQLQ